MNVSGFTYQFDVDIGHPDIAHCYHVMLQEIWFFNAHKASYHSPLIANLQQIR